MADWGDNPWADGGDGGGGGGGDDEWNGNGGSKVAAAAPVMAPAPAPAHSPAVQAPTSSPTDLSSAWDARPGSRDGHEQAGAPTLMSSGGGWGDEPDADSGGWATSEYVPPAAVTSRAPPQTTTNPEAVDDDPWAAMQAAPTTATKKSPAEHDTDPWAAQQSSGHAHKQDAPQAKSEPAAPPAPLPDPWAAFEAQFSPVKPAALPLPTQPLPKITPPPGKTTVPPPPVVASPLEAIGYFPRPMPMSQQQKPKRLEQKRPLRPTPPRRRSTPRDPSVLFDAEDPSTSDTEGTDPEPADDFGDFGDFEAAPARTALSTPTPGRQQLSRQTSSSSRVPKAGMLEPPPDFKGNGRVPPSLPSANRPPKADLDPFDGLAGFSGMQQPVAQAKPSHSAQPVDLETDLFGDFETAPRSKPALKPVAKQATRPVAGPAQHSNLNKTGLPSRQAPPPSNAVRSFGNVTASRTGPKPKQPVHARQVSDLVDLSGFEEPAAQVASTAPPARSKPPNQASPDTAEAPDSLDAWTTWDDTEAEPAQQQTDSELDLATFSPLLKRQSRITSSPAPINVPPPAVLLGIFPAIFETVKVELLDSLPAAGSQRLEVLQQLAVKQYLLDCIATATTLAYILAGRKHRWKRDTMLSQSMRIGKAGAGMKLASVDRAETLREDREAAGAVAAWSGIVGRLRQAVAHLEVAGAPARLPDIQETLGVRVVGDGIRAPKACALCGLRREERVAGAGSGTGAPTVSDVFGEFWVEHWGHRCCFETWGGQEAQLRTR